MRQEATKHDQNGSSSNGRMHSTSKGRNHLDLPTGYRYWERGWRSQRWLHSLKWGFLKNSGIINKKQEWESRTRLNYLWTYSTLGHMSHYLVMKQNRAWFPVKIRELQEAEVGFGVVGWNVHDYRDWDFRGAGHPKWKYPEEIWKYVLGT